MKYDFFTLLEWKSIPPMLNEYKVGDDSIVLPVGIFLAQRRGKYYLVLPRNSLPYKFIQQHTVSDNFNSVNDLLSTYSELAKRLSEEINYMSANQLDMYSHCRWVGKQTVSDQFCAEMGVELPKYFYIYLTRGTYHTCRYLPPERLRDIVGFNRRGRGLPNDQTKLDTLTRFITEMQRLHDKACERLLSEFKLHQQVVRNDPNIISSWE